MAVVHRFLVLDLKRRDKKGESVSAMSLLSASDVTGATSNASIPFSNAHAAFYDDVKARLAAAKKQKVVSSGQLNLKANSFSRRARV